MKGTRLPDTRFGELPEGAFDTIGAYWKCLNPDGSPMEANEEGNLTNTVWQVHPPIGGIATLIKHTVREEDDGTISVRPGDGSSNSIMVKGRDKGVDVQWHGYIEHGEWKPV